LRVFSAERVAPGVVPSRQILQVKTLLQEKEGITVAQIRLIHNGKQLADDKTLDSYSIAGGATLHMVLALRGGC
jgi:ubiquitin-like protein Nedd8